MVHWLQLNRCIHQNIVVIENIGGGECVVGVFESVGTFERVRVIESSRIFVGDFEILVGVFEIRVVVFEIRVVCGFWCEMVRVPFVFCDVRFDEVYAGLVAVEERIRSWIILKLAKKNI